jgi:FMN-dependent NADH-azoreductase
VKVLEIQSSPRGESSDSIALTKSFIEACKSDGSSIVVDTLNVWHEQLPEFDQDAIGSKYKAAKHETMFSERRPNRLRNSHVELWPALQAQTID